MDPTFWQRYVDQRAITEGCLEALKDERDLRLADVEVAAAEAAKTMLLMEHRQQQVTQNQANRVAMHYRQMGTTRTPLQPTVAPPPTEPASPPSTFYGSQMPSLWKPQCSELDSCSKNNFIPLPSACFAPAEPPRVLRTHSNENSSQVENSSGTSLPIMLESFNDSNTVKVGNQSKMKRRSIQDPRRVTPDCSNQSTTTTTPSIAPRFVASNISGAPIPTYPTYQQQSYNYDDVVTTPVNLESDTMISTTTSIPSNIGGCLLDDISDDESKVLNEVLEDQDDDLPEAPSVAFRLDPVLLHTKTKDNYCDIVSHDSRCSTCVDSSPTWVLKSASCSVYSQPDFNSAVIAMLHRDAVLHPMSSSCGWLQLQQGGWVHNGGWKLLSDVTSSLPKKKSSKKHAKSPFRAFTNEWKKLQALQSTGIASP